MRIRIFLLFITNLALFLLVSCGGGGTTTRQPDGPPPTGYVNNGQAVAAAEIVIRGADGSEVKGTTLSDGTFNLDLSKIVYPAIVKVSIPSASSEQISTLYGALTEPPSGPLMITGLTTAVVFGLANGEPDVLFQALGKSKTAEEAITTSRITTAEQSIRDYLAKIEAADFLAQVLPPANTFISSVLKLSADGVTTFANFISSALTAIGLGDLSASVLESLKVGCDVPELAIQVNNDTRWECSTSPNRPVSETVADHLTPVSTPRVTNPADRADELAGVTRGKHWKNFYPKIASDQIIFFLQPKLKNMVSDLWSGNQGISFPESLGIEDGPIDSLVESIIDIEWPQLAKHLTVEEVSNVTYEYQMLKQILGNADAAANLFSPLPLDSVSLASPRRINSSVSLAPFGAGVSAFAKSWLQDSGNRIDGVVIPEITIINDLTASMLDMAAFYDPSLFTNLQSLADQVTAAASALPSDYAALRQPSIDYANYLVSYFTCYWNYMNSIGPACAPYDSTTQNNFYAAYSQAATLSQTNNRETAGEFYKRFLKALATYLNDSYDNHFETVFPLDPYAHAASYAPLVIYAELHDSVASAYPCCFSVDDQFAYRSAMLYRVDGTSVQFNDYASTALAPAQIVSESFSAPPLISRSGSTVAGPFEVVATDNIILMSSAWVVALACVQTDTACKARMAKSVVATPITTVDNGPLSFSFDFNVINLSAYFAGGIYTTPPVWVQAP